MTDLEQQLRAIRRLLVVREILTLIMIIGAAISVGCFVLLLMSKAA